MSKNIKRVHSAEFKIKVVLDLLKQEETQAQICSRYSIHPTQLRRWKEKFLEAVKQGFDGVSVSEQLKEKDLLIEQLYKTVGKLQVELDWLKKKLGYPNS